MRPPSALAALAAHLAFVSSISFGGFPTVLPDVRSFVVLTQGWMTDEDFTSIFAMAQAIPDAAATGAEDGVEDHAAFEHRRRRGAAWLTQIEWRNKKGLRPVHRCALLA